MSTDSVFVSAQKSLFSARRYKNTALYLPAASEHGLANLFVPITYWLGHSGWKLSFISPPISWFHSQPPSENENILAHMTFIFIYLLCHLALVYTAAWCVVCKPRQSQGMLYKHLCDLIFDSFNDNPI